MGGSESYRKRAVQCLSNSADKRMISFRQWAATEWEGEWV